MNILVACEYSGRVRDALTEKGHVVWSCDLLPSETRGVHYQGDVRDMLKDKWDMMIAFPPCTDLCVSGARHFKAKRQDGRQQRAVEFFMMLASANVDKIAIENPIGIMSRLYRKPDQIIQPWQFGHDASKATCLWLKGLPPLTPTCIIPKPASGRWGNQTPSGQNKLGPGEHRAKLRSLTYSGVAQAMADQWG